jgi:ABC-2 type transport system permease protein
VNWQHLQAFIWLRWRLFANQMRKGGAFNAVLAAVLAVFAVLGASVLFVVFFVVGLFTLADKSPDVIMFVWDGLVAAFLFSWTIGLLVELQRSEVLSAEKFLHLPVSLKGVFLINYLSSLFSLTALIFVPAMFALSLALVIRQGPVMVLMFPLLAAFLLMVTAVTYQFQGWLAALMVNPRRRRTVIVVVTMTFVLGCQLPNLVNIFRPWENEQLQAIKDETKQKETEVNAAFNDGRIDTAERDKRQGAIQSEYHDRLQAQEFHTLDMVRQTIVFLNYALPPAWLALGAAGNAEGNALPALLATVAMGSIGVLCLWRSYQTTLRLYTGAFSSGKPSQVLVAIAAPQAPPAGRQLLEWRIPFLSEQASAIALGGFRSLIRAPEAKMLLLTPIILVVVLGSVVMSQSTAFPDVLRPFPAYGAMSVILLSMGQLVGNQFGFDRGGFRVFVLSSAPRRDILLGKNMACAPLALGFSLALDVVLQVMLPMRFDYFLALAPQMVSMYLVFCLLANLLSIFAPMPIRAGTMKPLNPRLVPILLHVVFAFFYPVVLAPTLLPLGIGLAFDEYTGISGVPLTLILSVLLCGLVVFLYWFILPVQGRLLHTRELRILEIVSAKGD